MILRIVRMTFQPDKVATFLAMFDERKERIRNFPGCQYLELWKQTGTDNVFFTYSHWDSESSLDHYRFSEFFKDTWTKTKACFAEKPQAWSVERAIALF
jgi:quinol monooxygenase YgiN